MRIIVGGWVSVLWKGSSLFYGTGQCYRVHVLGGVVPALKVASSAATVRLNDFTMIEPPS
jgi:hypothetical protein